MSVFGDVLRDLADKYSGGVFGQGNARKQPNETDEQYYQRIVKALGAASVSFNSTVKKTKMQKIIESFTSGATGQVIKNIAPLALIGLGAIIFIPKLRKKVIKSKKR